MTLGEKLKQLRKEAGLSQEQLAAQLSLSRSTVAKWEADLGIPNVSNLRALSQVLNVSIDELLTDSTSSSHTSSVRSLVHSTTATSRHTPAADHPKSRFSLWKQRFFFLLAAYLLLSFCLMWTPLSVAQVGLPDITAMKITAITFSGNRPRISTQDPALQAADSAIITAGLSRIQTELEASKFYCRTYPLNPLQLMSVNGTWMLIETDTGSYWFGDNHGLFFVEINGARRFYKWPSNALKKEIVFMQDYFIELEHAYYANLDPS